MAMSLKRPADHLHAVDQILDGQIVQLRDGWNI